MRCHSCKRLIFRAYLEGDSKVELKCGSCNTMNLITAKPIDGVLVPDGLGGYLTWQPDSFINKATE